MVTRESWLHPTRWTWAGFIATILLMLTVLQIGALFVGLVYPPANNFKIGFIFYLILLVGLILTFFKQIVFKKEFEKKDVLFFTLTVIGVIALIFFSKTYVPQVFSVYNHLAVPPQFQEGFSKAADATSQAISSTSLKTAAQSLVSGYF